MLYYPLLLFRKPRIAGILLSYPAFGGTYARQERHDPALPFQLAATATNGRNVAKGSQSVNKCHESQKIT